MEKEKKSIIGRFKELPMSWKVIIVLVGILVIMVIIGLIVDSSNSSKSLLTSNNSVNDSEMSNNILENIVTFPNGIKSLLGMEKDNAIGELEKIGVQVTINENTEYSDTVPANCIVKWSGRKANGKWHYKYEDLNSLEIAAYKDTLKDYPQQLQQVLYEKVYEYEKITDDNLSKGDTITLTLSKGKGIKMPNLIGMTEQQAINTIKENDLNYKRTEIESAVSYPNHTIIQQSIEAGTIVDPNQEVYITLNKFAEYEEEQQETKSTTKEHDTVLDSQESYTLDIY